MAKTHRYFSAAVELVDGGRLWLCPHGRHSLDLDAAARFRTEEAAAAAVVDRFGNINTPPFVVREVRRAWVPVFVADGGGAE